MRRAKHQQRLSLQQITSTNNGDVYSIQLVIYSIQYRSKVSVHPSKNLCFLQLLGYFWSHGIFVCTIGKNTKSYARNHASPLDIVAKHLERIQKVFCEIRLFYAGSPPFSPAPTDAKCKRILCRCKNVQGIDWSRSRFFLSSRFALKCRNVWFSTSWKAENAPFSHRRGWLVHYFENPFSPVARAWKTE